MIARALCITFVAWSALVPCALARAAAQPVSTASSSDAPSWLAGWSPLIDIASQTRQLPTAFANGVSLLYPQERLGLFWTAGNPAGLAFELADRWSDMSVASSGESGSFRRPLDPPSAQVARVSGRGWQPLGTTGAGIGGVFFDRTSADSGSISDVNRAYGSNPLVATDTSMPALRGTRMRLDGAGGWKRGPWGGGVAFGYDTRTTSSVESPFVRRNRSVLPAARFGVAREFRAGRVRVGAEAGWQSAEETVNLVAVGASGSAFQLEGYREITPLAITRTTPYYRRISRRMFAAGPSLAGSLGRGQWALSGRFGRLQERQTNARIDAPPFDRWNARSSSVALALLLPVRTGNALIAEARAMSVSGEGTLYPARTGLHTHDRETTARASLRSRSADGSSERLLEISFLLENHVRNDSVAAANTNVDALTTRVNVELKRRVWRALSLLGGVGIARYGGTGVIPLPTSRGDVFRRLFAPELDMATSVMWARGLTAGVMWNARSRTQVILSGRLEQLSTSSDWDFLPGGTRSRRSVSLGLSTSAIVPQ